MLQPDLSEARRLLGGGMKLVRLKPESKAPEGLEWNRHPVKEIDPDATGYGLLLAGNKLCSIDPDRVDLARIGMKGLGFDLDALMAAGVRTVSTRPGSGGRSTFAAEGDLSWLTFSSSTGTVLELRADSPNLQDCVPGLVYRDKAGRLCTQQYANGRKLDEAPPLPDGLYEWWSRCSTDLDFYREQQGKFFAAIGELPNQAVSGKGGKLAYQAPGLRSAFNARHSAEDYLDRHGYTWHAELQRWAAPAATGEPGIAPIPGREGLWCSHHASDPLQGTFDAWTAYVVLEHQGDLKAARAAAELELGLTAPDQELPPVELYEGEGGNFHDAVKIETDEPLFVDADTLRGGKYQTPEPIIENVLVPGATLVHGPAKKGKSWLLLQMATTIEQGRTFLGWPSHRRDVLYIGCEDNEARLKARLEKIGAYGSTRFMTRTALEQFSAALRQHIGDLTITAPYVIEALYRRAGRPSVMIIDTQQVFEHITGIQHGKPGDAVTTRDYQATSSYDGIANKLRIAIVLVGHWGKIKSIEDAVHNPHECLNTTKARLAGVTTSITLGPLPNQHAGESTREMQLSIRSRDLPGGDRFLWVSQDEHSCRFECLGPVKDILLTQVQEQLFEALLEVRKTQGADHWCTAAELADELAVSAQAVKQMVGRVRQAAKAKGRAASYKGYTLESKPKKGYRLG